MASDMRNKLDNVNVEDLTWKTELASLVISDNTNFYETLTDSSKRTFMKPFERMKTTLPDNIGEQCDNFVGSYNGEPMDVTLQKLRHNGKWHETPQVLERITGEILQILYVVIITM
jgi:hypothetical protein